MMRYKIVSTKIIRDELREETDKLLNFEDGKKNSKFDENDQLGVIKRYRSHKKYSLEESIGMWREHRQQDMIKLVCGSGRIADAIEDDYCSRHCFDTIPRLSFREAMTEWWENIRKPAIAEASDDGASEDKREDVKTKTRNAMDYFYDTLPKSVVLGGNNIPKSVIKAIYEHYLTESAAHGNFDPNKALKFAKSHKPVTIQMNEADFIICTF